MYHPATSIQTRNYTISPAAPFGDFSLLLVSPYCPLSSLVTIPSIGYNTVRGAISAGARGNR